MKTFQTYEQVDGMRECMEKPSASQALQIQEDFQVTAPDGTSTPGKAGDYLVSNTDDELSVFPRATYELFYEFVDA